MPGHSAAGARRRSVAGARARLGRRPERRQGVGGGRPQGRSPNAATSSAPRRTSCSRASGPESSSALGIGPDELPESVVYCSITGFGPDDLRAGHDLNYQGWAGLLADTAPAMPPVQIADLAAGALGAVTRILAALLERERTGRGAHLVVSLTHGATSSPRIASAASPSRAC